LIPKVICVGTLVGGLVSAGALWSHRQLGISGGDGCWEVMAISVVFRWVVVPALMATITLGLLLFLQHPRIFWSMRWFRVKLLLLAATLPVFHLTTRPVFLKIKTAYQEPTGLNVDPTGLASACRTFTGQLVLTILLFLTVILLGRLKPRLGQNFAKSRPKPTTK
jgi:hypothetical protein